MSPALSACASSALTPLRREIDVGVPDVAGRVEILKIKARGMALAQDVDLEQLGRDTHGWEKGAGDQQSSEEKNDICNCNHRDLSNPAGEDAAFLVHKCSFSSSPFLPHPVPLALFFPDLLQGSSAPTLRSCARRPRSVPFTSASLGSTSTPMPCPHALSQRSPRARRTSGTPSSSASPRRCARRVSRRPPRRGATWAGLRT